MNRQLRKPQKMMALPNGPLDVGFDGSDLIDRVVVVVGEDTEPRRLSLHPTLCVLETAWWIGPLLRTLRPDEELVRSVAKPSDTDCRVNLDARDGHCYLLPIRRPSVEIGRARNGAARVGCNG